MRSNLYRCLKRLNIYPKKKSRLLKKEIYLLGFVRIDSTEVLTNQGKCDLFMAIDRATKYVYVEMHSKMSVNESSAFLKNMISHCPFKITKILTDNGAQFTYKPLTQHLRPKKRTPLM
ncbi:DDE-type integrase/transposase/recombinase [Holospora obtusa]|uniref:DDE-type integrase/transposase/recombinase n=1 Tax=Holospora obtusa TaxID=49893 RepID=UPI003B83534F